jgi:squalene-associated FAD-dependent desaturase
MTRRVLIIGGGPAGLTAGLRLAARDYQITLVEARGELGGRVSRPAPAHADPADAPPTVILGCHRATIGLLRTLNTLRLAPVRRRVRLEFVSPGSDPAVLRRPWLPARLQGIVALATFIGLSARDRWSLLMLLERVWEGEALPADLELRTAEDWLAASGQSPTARAHCWNPLAHFLLGEDLAVASAGMFVTALGRVFLSSRDSSHVALPEVSIRRLLVRPAEEHLRSAGATIRLETTAAQLRCDQHRVTGLGLKSGELLTADWYVAAVPPSAMTPLLPERVMTHLSYFHQMLKLVESPALTVHLLVEQRGERPSPTRPHLFLLASRPFHWMLGRPVPGNPRQVQVSLVSSGRFDLLDLTDEALRDAALGEVASLSRTLAGARVLGAEIVRQPKAFLSVRPGTAALRPLPQSPFPNLLVAGDWTDTGWPATLESAILSGDRCADLIAAQSRS